MHRTQITAAGDRLKYIGKVTTHIASIEIIKNKLEYCCLYFLNTAKSEYYISGKSNMYLFSTLENAKYVHFPINLNPPKVIAHYNLRSLVHNIYAYVNFKKLGMASNSQVRLPMTTLLPISSNLDTKKPNTMRAHSYTK